MDPEHDRVAELAAKIRAAVAETAPPSAVPSSPRSYSPDEEAARTSLQRAAAYVTPSIPDSSRMARGKRAALRLLRFLWRDQGAFNALSLEATRALLAELAAARDRQDRLTDEIARIEAALHADWSRTKASLEKVVARRSAIQDARLAELEKAPSRGPSAPPIAGPPASAIPPGVYSLFEERFRGSPEQISEKQRKYLSYLGGIPGPVLDVGCGRGEFLRLLRTNGIPASGIETNPIAVAECRQAGLEVEETDGLVALASRTGGSLGAIVAFQVVEHWSPDQIFFFLREARRVLAPGGTLIAETINVDSISAWRAFYLDPSHVRPVPAGSLAFLAEAAGFIEVRIEYEASLPAGDRLEEHSENDAKLNRLLFAEQDYALVARVPSATGD